MTTGEALSFSCPHCDHVYVDDLELLDLDCLHDFICESCHQSFTVHLHECPQCCVEAVLTWQSKPLSESIAKLNCTNCGNAYQPSEELVP